jgi:hypothetical protein
VCVALQVEKPLDEATKYAVLLQEHAGQLIETHILSIELYTRKGRFLKSLQAIRRAAAVGALAVGSGAPHDHPALHRSVTRFLVSLHEKRSSLDPAVEKVIGEVLADASKWGMAGLEKAAAEYNETFIKAHAKKSLAHGVAAAWSLLHISKGDAGAMTRAVELVMGADVGASTTLSEAMEAKAALKEEMGFSADQVAAFCAKARTRFPLATAFK